jgi:predicted nucleic acid-binding protein
MAGLVIDCSIVAAWLIPGERNDAIDRILSRVTEEGALVPGLWRIEIANVLLMAERRKRIGGADRVAALASLAGLSIEADPDTWSRAWSETLPLAHRFRLSAYDAAYLELAHRAGLPLATLDHDLRDAAAQLGVPLVRG